MMLTLDNGVIRLELDPVPDGGLLVHSFHRTDDACSWVVPESPTGLNLISPVVQVRGLAPQSGFVHTGHAIREISQNGTELSVDFEHSATGLHICLRFTVYPNIPFLSMRVLLTNIGDTAIPDVSRFDPISLLLKDGEKPYRAYWVTRNSYGLHSAEVADALTVDGGNWNGPEAAGWLALEHPERPAFLVMGIEWERHWRFALNCVESGGVSGLHCSAGLKENCTVSLEPGATLESPTVFLGIVNGDLDDASNATRDYLQSSVLPPLLPGFPYISYDIWSTEGESVEPRIIEEARFAAEELGVEVFYHDASWYRDSDVTDKGRWGVGLGGYSEDLRKLPHGLRYLADAVHGMGMKFGLWVCPEMVDVTVQNHEGIPDRWMTTANGQFNIQSIPEWNPMKMLCLGCPEVEAHLREKLLQIVEAFDLDWLKWDASGLPGLDIVCDRTDHGHQAGEGSMAAVWAKYRILSALRERFPDLIIEQCSYGTRLDYGMGRYGARANWLSDSTAPSSHVRDNVMAAAYVLPASHNYTWIMLDDEVKQPQTPAFLDTMFRSRMMGGFGFGTLHGSLTECISLYPPDVIEAAKRNIRNYRTYRHLLSQHCYHLTPFGREGEWQGMQFAARDGKEAVAFLFRNGAADVEHRFPLRGLDPDIRYTVTRLNTGTEETWSGKDLRTAGVTVALTQEPQESEILVIKGE